MESALTSKLSGNSFDKICVRVITVPLDLIDPDFTFSEFVAKNVAISRARGSTIVTTNLDNFFSNNLVRIASGIDRAGNNKPLNNSWFIRAMRFNMDSSVGSLWWKRGHDYERDPSLKIPVSIDSLLEWMGSNHPDETSMMEMTYEKQNEQHLGHFSHFDELCLESQTLEVEDGQIEHGDYSAAAGDFTLASATAWHKLFGYPEVFK